LSSQWSKQIPLPRCSQIYESDGYYLCTCILLWNIYDVLFCLLLVIVHVLQEYHQWDFMYYR
jgi:hypothetical protein